MKLRCDGPLSNVAFEFNLCRYTKGEAKKEKELGNAAYKAKNFDEALEHYDKVGRCRLTLRDPS